MAARRCAGCALQRRRGPAARPQPDQSRPRGAGRVAAPTRYDRHGAPPCLLDAMRTSLQPPAGPSSSSPGHSPRRLQGMSKALHNSRDVIRSKQSLIQLFFAPPLRHAQTRRFVKTRKNRASPFEGLKGRRNVRKPSGPASVWPTSRWAPGVLEVEVPWRCLGGARVAAAAKVRDRKDNDTFVWPARQPAGLVSVCTVNVRMCVCVCAHAAQRRAHVRRGAT